MGFESIMNQPLAVELIRRWVGQGSTQPLLLWGPEGTGKRTLALEATKALNCKNPKKSSPGPEGCGTCPSCKKILSGNHPDVRTLNLEYQSVIRGEPIEKQQALKIETILDERKRLYETAIEGPWKVSVIDDAHHMTPDAANVLLKVMEEPPKRTAIFLMTPHRDRLLATLVSRCQAIRFRPLSESDAQKRLAPEQRQWIQDAETLWEQLPKLTVPQILSKTESRTRTTAAVARQDIEARLHALLVPAAKAVRRGQADAAQKVQWIQKAQLQLKNNVPPQLVYDHLLLQLARDTAQ
jgi:DNA polymerase-3 subunit delta'